MNKMTKRLLCLVLVFVMLIPANMVFADNFSPAGVLEELGIAEPVRFPYFHLNYTRIEFAKMLCNIDAEYYFSGDEGDVGSDMLTSPINSAYYYLSGNNDGEGNFADVMASDSKYVSYVVENKYMSLDGNGRFNPNDKVTYNDVVIALVALLDYGNIAQSNGGNVVDYLNVAKRIGLTKGVTASADGTITKDNLATIVLNALEIAPAEISYDGAYIAKPSVLDSKDLVTGEAKILATDTASIGAPLCEEGYVNLGGNVIKTEKEIDDSLVGKLVQYYVRVKGSIKTLVALGDLSGETLTFNANDIYDVKFGSSQFEFKYGDNKTVRIPYTATFCVNGKPGDITKEIFNVFESGELVVFDSDNNGSFDTVNMFVCLTEVVDSASTDGKTINTRYTKKHLDLDKNDNVVVVYEAGRETTMAAIRNGSVVSIACDAYTIANGKITFDYAKAKYVKVYVSNRKVTGELEYMSNDGYSIDGRSYTTLPILATVEKSGLKNKIDTGSSYEFCMDAFGNLCDYNLVEAGGDMVYGYLMDGGDISNGFENNAQVRILTLGGEFEIYDIREKYIVDGERYEISADAMPEILKKRQLIRYRLSGGKVAEIDTTTIGDDEIPETSLTLDATKASRRYSSNQRGFLDYKIMVTDNTKVFIASDKANADDANYVVSSAGKFVSMEYLTTEGYDIGEMGETGCIIVYQDVTDEIDRATRAYMVEKFSKAINDKGDDVYRMVLHGHGGSITVDTVDRSEVLFADKSTAKVKTIENIGKGDIIRFTQNVSKEVLSIERVFCLAEEPKFFDPYYTANEQSGIAHYGYGQYYQSNKTHFEFTTIENLQEITQDDKHVFAYKYAGKVPVYNMKDNTMTLYSSNYQDIPTYLNSAERVTVFLHMNIYELTSIAVYIWE